MLYCLSQVKPCTSIHQSTFELHLVALFGLLKCSYYVSTVVALNEKAEELGNKFSLLQTREIGMNC